MRGKQINTLDIDIYDEKISLCLYHETESENLELLFVDVTAICKETKVRNSYVLHFEHLHS